MEDHEKTRDAALAYLQRCWDERAEMTIDRIGVLLYKYDTRAHQVTSWKWFGDWHKKQWVKHPS